MKWKESFSFGVLGSGCLFLGLLLTLFKYAHSLWPIVAAAILGSALVAAWRKIGLILSLVFLACALGKTLMVQAFFWPILLSSSIAISWLVFYLEQERRMLLFQEKEDLLASLQSDSERLKAISFRDALERAQLESELKIQKRALESALAELRAPVEKKEDLDELKSLQALQVQHAQLREQFVEKSEVLHQTRKELFALESTYLALKNALAEKACTPLEEHSVLAQCLERLNAEEEQVLVLEEILSSVLAEKKPSVPRKRKAKKELDLFLMAQEKMQLL